MTNNYPIKGRYPKADPNEPRPAGAEVEQPSIRELYGPEKYKNEFMTEHYDDLPLIKQIKRETAAEIFKETDKIFVSVPQPKFLVDKYDEIKNKFMGGELIRSLMQVKEGKVKPFEFKHLKEMVTEPTDKSKDTPRVTLDEPPEHD